MKEYPTQEQIKSVLNYDPLTGVFTWKRTGKIAGKYASNGYRMITVPPVKTCCLAHRLAWIYVYGTIPTELDHRNKARDANHISNLRELAHQSNSRNYSINKNNTSGVNGVSYHNRYKTWRSRIKVNYKSIHLGMFANFDEAVKARYTAEIKYGFTEMNEESTAFNRLQAIG